MRLLLLSKIYSHQPSSGGTEAMAQVIAQGLAARGHEVSVLASRRACDHVGPPVTVRAWLEMDRPHPGKMPSAWTIADKAMFIQKTRHNYAATRRAIRDSRPDVVYLNDVELLTGSVFAACVNAGVPVVWHAHDHILHDMVVNARQAPDGSGPKRWLLRRLIPACSLAHYFATPLIAVSRFIADKYVQLGWPPERVHVVPNGIPDCFFEPHVERVQGNRPFRLLFVGRCVPDKGLALLPKLLRMVLDRGVDAHLSLVGKFRSPADEEAFVAEVSRDGLRDRVSLGGVVARSEMPTVYSEADCLLAPSLSEEAFGLMSVEAQARGTPVVAFRTGGLPETVLDGETGFLCERGDVEAMAERVCQLARNRALWQQMSRAASSFAARRFRLAEKLDAIERIVTEVARRA